MGFAVIERSNQPACRSICSGTPVYLIHKGEGQVVQTAKRIVAESHTGIGDSGDRLYSHVCMAGRPGQGQSHSKKCAAQCEDDLANNAESDLGVLNLAALQDGQTAYIPFQMENYSNIPSAVSFRVLVKDANGEEITDALEGWEVSILSEGEPLKLSEDGTSFIAEVPAVENGSEINAYTLQLKAAPDADYSELGTEDAQLYVTADIRILEEETVQE